ncbi:MAG: hypothetical protein LBJ76_03870 [Candidatus Accumulibacter sp.]|nr:hypothetical protein [Accumulibacter sp.]
MRAMLVVAALLMSAPAEGAEKIPCTEIGSPLFYVAYGVETPKADSGWKCSAASAPSSLFIWEKDGKNIIFVEDDFLAYANSPEDPGNPEPLASIRTSIESFLGDKSVLDKNGGIRVLYEFQKDRIMGVFFGKNRKNIIVCTDNGPHDYKGKKKVSFHNVFIYRSDNDKKWLNTACYGCTFGDLFTYVIEPALQARN